MSADATINEFLQLARSVNVISKDDMAMVAWRLACAYVKLEGDIDEQFAEIRELRAQLQEREKPKCGLVEGVKGMSNESFRAWKDNQLKSGQLGKGEFLTATERDADAT